MYFNLTLAAMVLVFAARVNAQTRLITAFEAIKNVNEKAAYEASSKFLRDIGPELPNLDSDSGRDADIDDDPLATGSALSPSNRNYILYWLFYFSGNPDPATVLPGGDFRDSSIGFTSNSALSNFVNTATNYKLINRFQVKYRLYLDGSGFNGTPVQLQTPLTSIGSTVNPCGGLMGIIMSTVSGQSGPSNGVINASSATAISQINDGSPDSAAVAAFNTLTGKDTTPAVFWENIGTKITFAYNYGTSPLITTQPYPTYNLYQNGRLISEIPEALSPTLNFNAAPFPSGTVPCTFYAEPSNIPFITPGGRCGDQHSAPDPSVRVPPPAYVQP